MNIEDLVCEILISLRSQSGELIFGAWYKVDDSTKL